MPFSFCLTTFNNPLKNFSPMLKAQLHIHTKEDPIDNIDYTAKQLIDHAAQQNFDVLAFTCHDKVVHNQELKQYAQNKNILLIPGVERTIQGKHVLIYNLTEEESQQITSFQKLNQLKKQKQFLVIAAHPFQFGPTCLKNKVFKYFNLFDVWEYSFFYTKTINKNKKAVKLAKKYQKPLIGSSDVHKLSTLEKTYTLINAEKNTNSIFQAIKNNQTKIKTTPLSFLQYSGTFLQEIISSLKNIRRCP